MAQRFPALTKPKGYSKISKNVRQGENVMIKGDVRPHLARKNKTHDRRRKLEQHDLSCYIARDKLGHPRAGNVQLDLNTNYRTDEKRDKQHYADGVNTQGRHFLQVLLHEHSHTLGA